MKNRLQFNYYMPSNWPYERENALEFIENLFSKNVGSTPSLPAEPVVVFYGKNRDMSNAVIAVGRGGDGIDCLKNRPYFIIDTAEMVRRLDGIDENIMDIDDKIVKIFDAIDNIKDGVANNLNEINTINTEIFALKEKDTEIEGVIETLKGKDSDIDKEIFALKEKDSDIEGVIEALKSKDSDIENVIDDIREQSKDDKIELLGEIEKESIRATGVENGIKESLTILRGSFSEESNKVQGQISDIYSNIDEVFATAQKELTDVRSEFIEADKTLKGDLKSEIGKETDRAKAVEDGLATRVETLESLTGKTLNNESAIKRNQVLSNNKTIVRDVTEEGTDIRVNIDNNTIISNDGILSVDSSKLRQYDGTNAIVVSDIENSSKQISLVINETEDKILVNGPNGLYADLTLEWVKETNGQNVNQIQLKGKNQNVISTIEVAEFLKDGMIDNVSYDKDRNVLVFTFNTAGNKEQIEVELGSLVNLYNAGNGLSLDGGVFSVKVDGLSEFLSVSENGVKVSGVQQAINTAVSDVTNEVKVVSGELNNKLNSEINAIKSNILTDISMPLSTAISNIELLKEDVSEHTILLTDINEDIDGINGTIGDIQQDINNLTTFSGLTQTELTDVNNTLKTIVNGDSVTEGSIKHILDVCLKTEDVTTITPAEAATQTLIKRIIVGNDYYYYVSNNANDILYPYKDGDTQSYKSLTTAMNEVLADNIQMRKELDENHRLMQELREKIEYLEGSEYRQNIVNEVSNGIVETIMSKFEGTEQQIKVVKTYNAENTDMIETLKIGFADDAIFKANESTNE